MMARVKVDEDLPTAVIELLRAAGYDAAGVLEESMGGWKDTLLWQAVQTESRFLITADKGFGDIRSYPPGSHAGILVLRPAEDGIRPLVDLISRSLAQYSLDDLAGAVAVVTPRGIRIRRSPLKQK
jgi:predicted nuclease of predicted toxin-antitoxin system